MVRIGHERDGEKGEERGKRATIGKRGGK